MVRDHGRVQPQPLAFACQAENAVAGSRRAAGRKVEAVAHRVDPLFDLSRIHPMTGQFGRH